jgi:hypothetical protein
MTQKEIVQVKKLKLENSFNGEPPNNRNRPTFDGEQPSRKSS